MNRAQAVELLQEYVKNPALVRHGLAVEAAMRYYARLGGFDEERWGLVGILHDFDYERWPEPPDHTREGARILRDKGLDDEIVGAILSHATWNLDAYPRDTPLRKTLFAVDELCGFINAVSVIRPERIGGLTPKSVKKKMKAKGFAAAVSRDDITQGAESLGLTLDDHIANCIAAMQEAAEALDLQPLADDEDSATRADTT